MAIEIPRGYYSQSMPRVANTGFTFTQTDFGTRHTRIRHLLKVVTECNWHTAG